MRGLARGSRDAPRPSSMRPVISQITKRSVGPSSAAKKAPLRDALSGAPESSVTSTTTP